MTEQTRGSANPAPGAAKAAPGGAIRWWILTAVLVLLGAAFIGFRAATPSGEPVANPAAVSQSTGADRPEPASLEIDTTSATVEGAPTTLRVPALGLDESLITLGLNPDETVEVPTDYSRAGWYEFGPAPGEEGSAVILGHVDSFAGPAVFHRLAELTTDDVVEVGLADGGIAHFAVTAVETYPKVEFPADQVYGPNGGASLQLVTCGGEFDSVAGDYVSNVVAYTSLIGITPPG